VIGSFAKGHRESVLARLRFDYAILWLLFIKMLKLSSLPQYHGHPPKSQPELPGRGVYAIKVAEFPCRSIELNLQNTDFRYNKSISLGYQGKDYEAIQARLMTINHQEIVIRVGD
jgi:hypothetical protein